MIKSLSISQLLLSDAGLITLLKACPSLHNLRILDCAVLSSRCIPTIGSNCPKLKSIEFIYTSENYTSNFDGTILTQFVQNCNIALKSMSVVGFREVSDIGVSYISECYYNTLQKVNFSRCPKLTNSSISTLAGTCRLLQEVVFNGNVLLTDEALCVLSQRCPRLQRVDFGKCPLLTESGVREFAVRCVYLKEVSFENCPMLGNSSFEAFLRKCPGLQMLNYSGTGIKTLPVLLLLPRRLGELRVDNCLDLDPLHADLASQGLEAIYKHFEDNQLSWRLI